MSRDAAMRCAAMDLAYQWVTASGDAWHRVMFGPMSSPLLFFFPIMCSVKAFIVRTTINLMMHPRVRVGSHRLAGRFPSFCASLRDAGFMSSLDMTDALEAEMSGMVGVEN